MTGIYNPDYGHYTLTRMIKLLQRFEPGINSIGVVMGDIYHLKVFHDRVGHPPIDDILVKTGQALQMVARQDDIVCRIGGDEFLIIMPNTSLEEVEEYAERFRQSAEQVRLVVKGEEFEHMIFSIGKAYITRPDSNSFSSTSNFVFVKENQLLLAADSDLERDRLRNEQRFSASSSFPQRRESSAG